MAVSIGIGITQNSQNIANNTSNVTVKVNISWTLGSWNQESPAPSGWLKIDGVTYNFASTFNPNRTTTGSQTLYTKTVTISHNSDGSKTVSCSASFASGVSSGTVTASGSKVLTTIPRATKPAVDVSSADMGARVTINCPRATSSFTHDLSYKIPGDSDYIVIASGVGTSYSWTVPDRATSIPTSTGVQMTLRCITRSGSTTVGTAYAYITANVPSSVIPTVDTVTTAEIVSGLAAQFQTYVQSKSKIRVSISASGAKGSTIKEYSSTFAGKTYSGSSWTSDTLSNAGKLTIKTRVKDSRGRWSEYKDTTILVEAYSNPQIRSMAAYRCNSAGAPDDEGIYLAIGYDYSVASVGGKNTAAATVKYKLSTETSYRATLLTLTALAESTTYKPASPTFSVDNSYHFEMIVEDWFGATATSVTILPSGKVILDIKANGLGLGIGKVSETDCVDIGWDVQLNKLKISDELSINGPLRTANVEPDNPDGDASIGTEQNPYLSGFFKNLYAGGVAVSGIEEGQSGNWHYLKFSNGFCTLIFRGTVTGSSTIPLLGGYNSDITVTYPFSLKTVYGGFCSMRLGTGTGFGYVSTGSSSCNVFVVGNQNSKTASGFITILGRWK